MSPGLTPLLEGTETLAPLAEGAEALSPLAEAVETLVALAEDVYAIVTHLGFFPGTTLQTSEHYPFPGANAYPGDTTNVVTDAPVLALIAEGTETLTPLLED